VSADDPWSSAGNLGSNTKAAAASQIQSWNRSWDIGRSLGGGVAAPVVTSNAPSYSSIGGSSRRPSSSAGRGGRHGQRYQQATRPQPPAVIPIRGTENHSTTSPAPTSDPSLRDAHISNERARQEKDVMGHFMQFFRSWLEYRLLQLSLKPTDREPDSVRSESKGVCAADKL
jgi:hypothetical protein